MSLVPCTLCTTGLSYQSNNNNNNKREKKKGLDFRWWKKWSFSNLALLIWKIINYSFINFESSELYLICIAPLYRSLLLTFRHARWITIQRLHYAVQFLGSIDGHQLHANGTTRSPGSTHIQLQSRLTVSWITKTSFFSPDFFTNISLRDDIIFNLFSLCIFYRGYLSYLLYI